MIVTYQTFLSVGQRYEISHSVRKLGGIAHKWVITGDSFESLQLEMSHSWDSLVRLQNLCLNDGDLSTGQRFALCSLLTFCNFPDFRTFSDFYKFETARDACLHVFEELRRVQILMQGSDPQS